MTNVNPMSQSAPSLHVLPPFLDAEAAAGLLDTLRGGLQSGRAWSFDASAVELVSLPCAQVLFAAMRDHEGVGIARPSPAFVAAFEDVGLAWREADVTAPSLEEGAAQAPACAEPDLAPIDAAVMPKRILTIDDSRTIRDMLRLTLVEAGYEVLQGIDGEDGLNVLGDAPIDVVITDINMPKMDGYEVIRRLRASAAHKTTPILVLTTESDADKRSIARDAGATGWIVKPFDPERLVATVRKVAP